MSLETGTRIADLVATNPVGATDFVSQGDDHIRLIKACVKGSFPNLGATAVAATAEELNFVDGVTSALQTQLDNKQPLDTDLSAIAALSTTSFGRNLLTLADAAAARGNIGAQADDADLTAIAALTTTTFGRDFLTLANLAALATKIAAMVPAWTGVHTFSAAGKVADFNSAGDTYFTISKGGAIGGYIGLASALIAGGSATHLALIVDSGDHIKFSCGGTVVAFDIGASGCLFGNPTSGALGAGSINAEAAFVNGRRLGFIDLKPQTAGFTRGEVYDVTTGKTLNTSDMAEGYTFGIYNNSASSITITQGSGVTLRLHGTTTTGNRTLGPRGFATIWCRSNTEAICMGDVT